MTVRIALIGDYDDTILAHQAIPKALALSAEALDLPVDHEWINSNDLSVESLSDQFNAYQGMWVVPASPYRNRGNVLKAIRHAREENLPFLGTCGGFQHAILEFSQHVLGLDQAETAEENPGTELPIISALSCAMSERTAEIQLEPDSQIATMYNATSVREKYNCSFGFNSAYTHLFDGSDLSFTGHDSAGEIRAFEIRAHRFYVGTAFQPERSSLSGQNHRLVNAFVRSAARA